MIGHRGASGHRPEHTTLAYRLAWRMGADSVEPDVVSTRDGVLVCRHDLDLGLSTDVAEHPEFAHRRRHDVVAGVSMQGWLVQDFDLAELRRLKARERWPSKRPRSAAYDGNVGVVTLEELLDLREAESARAGRRLGVHIELKHPEVFAALGMPLHEPLVDLLRATRPDLGRLAGHGDVLRGAGAQAAATRGRPRPRAARRPRPGRARRRMLRRTAGYATGVGLHKHLVLPRDRHDRIGAPGRAVEKVHASGLDLLVWTLRNENRHLPANLRRPGRPRAHGDAGAEVERFLDVGVDGLLTDFPDVALEVLAGRTARPGAVAARVAGLVEQVADAGAQLAQDAGEQARDLHLGHPDAGRDLALGQPLVEPHRQDLAVALGQQAHDGLEHQPRLGGRVVGVVVGQQVAERGQRVAARGMVERGRHEAAVAGQRLDDRLPRHSPRWSATSTGRGARPSRLLSSASATLMRAWSSWMRRGGRIIQPWSRKCLRSSPRIVGTA